MGLTRPDAKIEPKQRGEHLEKPPAGPRAARLEDPTSGQQKTFPQPGTLRVEASMIQQITKGSQRGDTLSLSCEASVGTSGSNN